MPEEQPPHRPGSLRSLLSSLAALAVTRAELFGIEAQEQQERLLGHVLIGAAALVAVLLSLMAGLLFVMVVTPPQWRALVLGGLALLFLLAAAWLLWLLSRRLNDAPAPFAQSLSEVKKDWRNLTGKDPS